MSNVSLQSSDQQFDQKLERIMAAIDLEGLPPLPISDWLILLKEIQSECQTRIVAAQEDAQRGMTL